VTRTGGWSIDDIAVEAPQACSTASLGPAPAGDGRNGTSPLRGDRVAVDGSAIDVTWDVTSCTASTYNLIYGNLADVASSTIAGSACSIGNTGALNWTGVPGGDLYFLVVGTDGGGIESSWGRASSGVERNGGTASGECGVSSKDATGTCP
jgi:hypothetical protein